MYEPLVHVVNGVAHTTSRAAEPALSSSQDGACYHRTCSYPDREPATVG